MKALASDMAVFFVKCNRKPPLQLTESMTESTREELMEEFSLNEDGTVHVKGQPNNIMVNAKLFEQLCELGYLSLDLEKNKVSSEPLTNSSVLMSIRPKSNLIEDFSLFPCFSLFVRQVLRFNVVAAATVLNEAHVRVLGMFITTAFDMARDMIVTPRRLDYAREKEEELYKALMESASRKQEEIKELIHATICHLSPGILDEVEHLKFEGVKLLEGDILVCPKELEYCTTVIQELVLGRINKSVAGKLISSVEYLRDSFVGTLKRCIESLEKMDRESVWENGDSATSSLRHVSAALLTLKHQYQNTISPYLSPYLFHRSSVEKLLKYQDNLT